MTVAIVVQPEAGADIASAVEWYRSRREELGADFLSEVDRVFRRIAESPPRAPAIHRNVRRVSLRRFPHVVLYMAGGDRVHVLAVLHQRRDPDISRSRARGFDA